MSLVLRLICIWIILNDEVHVIARPLSWPDEHCVCNKSWFEMCMNTAANNLTKTNELINIDNMFDSVLHCRLT